MTGLNINPGRYRGSVCHDKDSHEDRRCKAYPSLTLPTPRAGKGDLSLRFPGFHGLGGRRSAIEGSCNQVRLIRRRMSSDKTDPVSEAWGKYDTDILLSALVMGLKAIRRIRPSGTGTSDNIRSTFILDSWFLQ